jgi:hypothetical protein
MSDLNLEGLSDKQLRLFAVRCARRVQHLVPYAHLQALDVAKRYANGEATDKKLVAAKDAAEAATWYAARATAEYAAGAAAWYAAWVATEYAAEKYTSTEYAAWYAAQVAAEYASGASMWYASVDSAWYAVDEAWYAARVSAEYAAVRDAATFMAAKAAEDAGNKAWDAAREAQRKILAEVREVLT